MTDVRVDGFCGRDQAWYISNENDLASGLKDGGGYAPIRLNVEAVVMDVLEGKIGDGNEGWSFC